MRTAAPRNGYGTPDPAPASGPARTGRLASHPQARTEHRHKPPTRPGGETVSHRTHATAPTARRSRTPQNDATQNSTDVRTHSLEQFAALRIPVTPGGAGRGRVGRAWP